jgi:hypothetical protein
VKFRTEKQDAVEQAIEAARKAIADCAEGQLKIAEFEAAVTIAKENAVVGDGLKIAGQIHDLEIMRRDAEKRANQARYAIGRIYHVAAEAESEFAEAKRQKREEILVRIRKPLTELSQILDVPFTVFVLKSQPKGVWEGIFNGAEPDFEKVGPLEVGCRGGQINPEPYFIPLTERLGAEIKAHLSRATELSERKIDASADLAAALEAIIGEVRPQTPAAQAEAA